ncbi:hypothetical protein HC725_06215 [Vibrio sp. S17_S38]|uniref:hypothetical protein n=1 Tax=Vibrio sp. S17_S38 TaxID=2720229 RepID=UPI0016818282|nr:hypothetical protein [Vibrio sp. S17_S38]MBD1572874.1 hypothetical protein [Vibrio sp. S17_S38]
MNIRLQGKNSDLMMARLKSFNLEDSEGVKGDSLTITLSSDDVGGLPPKGEFYLVYLGNVERGRFSISQRKFSVYPKEITIVMTAAPLSVKDKEFRARKSSSWDQCSLNQIVQEATPTGFEIFVHPALQNIQIEHTDRTEESTSAFLNRLAKDYDAVAKPVGDKFVFVPKGQAKSASGAEIETITLSLPKDNSPSNASFVNVSGSLDGSNEFNGVKAFYSTTVNGQRLEVEKGSEPFKRLAKDKNTKQDAIQACAAELRKINREGRKISVEAPIDPNAFAEGVLILDASFDAVIRGNYSIDRASFSGSGLQASRMSLTATLVME